MLTYQCPSGHVVMYDDDVVLPGKLSIGSHGYAQLSGALRGTTVLLHRWLLGCTLRDGRLVDHRNRNKLDCRRENLRITTPSGNNQNRVLGPRANAYPMRGKWQAKVKLHGVQRSLGVFLTPEEAQAVARAWKAEHYTEAF